jgi:uncharacterized membrane protein YdjX (TVP38/TMEM64 family)
MPDNHATSRPASKKMPVARLLLFLLLVLAIISLRYFHIEQYMDKERLRQFIASFGVWGPVLYLMVWTLAPVLFLPGLPITLAGGVLFGPLWGIIYVALGSLSGATLSFLVARYLARDWVAARISGTKVHRLDEKVAEHGWKIVAFTRLVPIFPYFLVNYTFGLTRIALLPYAVSTFFAMLPLTIAYVYFSSHILDLFQGKVSGGLIVGIILVALVSLIPLVYRKIKATRGDPLEL